MVKVLAHPTQVQTLLYTYINVKDGPWGLGHLGPLYLLSCLIFYLILSTTNHVFLALLDVI